MTSRYQKPSKSSRLTLQRANEVLSYDAGTGIFRWKVRVNRRGNAGDVAGSHQNKGYIQIGLDGENHLAHRLAWFMEHGSWPALQIDHINGERKDNTLINLREVDQTQNNANTRVHKDNLSGVKGVSWDGRRDRWVARIRENGKGRFLGSFLNKKEAEAAYQTAATAAFGPFARHAAQEYQALG